MRNRSNFNDFFSRDRKILYIVLSIVMVSVLTLTVVYAALSTTLNINGQAEVSSASWDIHLANVQLNSRSATTTAPAIVDSKTASFSTTLSKPGDFYEFTIDVVNEGTIDAMIDSVTKTPELTANQKKYLNYIVEYQNGEAITSKQLVAKESFVRLKVKLEFRKDITASDLPTTSETLSLSFTVNYVQADTTGTNVTDNGVRNLYNVVSGDLNTVGSEVSIGDEHFYIMKNDGEYLTLLSKYNLHVGNSVADTSFVATPLENPTGIQDSTAIGSYGEGETPLFPWIGTIAYSSTNYWWDSTNSTFKTGYPADAEIDGTSFPYVYDSNSTLYTPVQNYKTYLESQGANIEEARLIKLSELLELGCSTDDYSCASAPEWVYGTSYWSGAADDGVTVFSVDSDGGFRDHFFDLGIGVGVRPVIKVLESEF